MDVFRVAFIGHREVDDFRLIEERLDEIIRNLIDTKEYVEFYVGRNGEFDSEWFRRTEREARLFNVAEANKRIWSEYATFHSFTDWKQALLQEPVSFHGL